MYIYMNFTNMAKMHEEEQATQFQKTSEVIQLISPACIVSKGALNNHLASAQVLQKITDHDISVYRRNDAVDLNRSFTENFYISLYTLMNMQRKPKEVLEDKEEYHLVEKQKRASILSFVSADNHDGKVRYMASQDAGFKSVDSAEFPEARLEAIFEEDEDTRVALNVSEVEHKGAAPALESLAELGRLSRASIEEKELDWWGESSQEDRNSLDN
jgi:hypothetical protein